MKACLVVADFTDATSNAGEYRPEFGRGMSTMLITALADTGHFRVLEREKWEALRVEQRQRGAARGNPCPGGTLLVTGAITAWDPDVAGGACDHRVRRPSPRLERGSTADYIVQGLDLLGQLGCAVRKAYLAADIRVVDIQTTEVVKARAVQATATGGRGGAVFDSRRGGSGLEVYAKTPMGKVIRAVIGEMTTFLTAETPRHYFQAAALR
jgi:curli biogenesis system outer membrane secretion channel CsgG